jgi:hypothetical protein
MVLLSDDDMAKLAQANRLLTQLTESHSHSCHCLLCEARWMTDVQGPASRAVPCVVLAGGE